VAQGNTEGQQANAHESKETDPDLVTQFHFSDL
jgi:hypothetical protein